MLSVSLIRRPSNALYKSENQTTTSLSDGTVSKVIEVTGLGAPQVTFGQHNMIATSRQDVSRQIVLTLLWTTNSVEDAESKRDQINNLFGPIDPNMLYYIDRDMMGDMEDNVALPLELIFNTGSGNRYIGVNPISVEHYQQTLEYGEESGISRVTLNCPYPFFNGETQSVTFQSSGTSQYIVYSSPLSLGTWYAYPRIEFTGPFSYSQISTVKSSGHTPLKALAINGLSAGEEFYIDTRKPFVHVNEQNLFFTDVTMFNGSYNKDYIKDFLVYPDQLLGTDTIDIRCQMNSPTAASKVVFKYNLEFLGV